MLEFNPAAERVFGYSFAEARGREMESTPEAGAGAHATGGLGGATHVSAEVRNLLRATYTFEERGEIALKGKGTRTTFLLTGRA